MKKPYDPQPGESAKAFKAFKTYVEMGPTKRSIRNVAKMLRKSSTVINRWRAKWNWSPRVKAWDEDQGAIEKEAMEKVAREDAQVWAKRQDEFRKQRFEIGQAMLAKAKQILEWPLARKTITGPNGETTIIEPAKWTTRDAARIADVGAALTALAVGLPTSKTEISAPDGPVVATGQVVIYLPERDRLEDDPPAQPGEEQNKT